jgi:hypothetical protein
VEVPPMMIPRPFFLVGAERSGSTMLRLMLDHHGQIACSSEFEYSVDLMPDHEGWPPLEAYHDALATHRIFQSHRYAIDPGLSYPALVNSFLVQFRERRGKPVIGATVHRHFDRLLRIWPDALFIHLLRDGRDVARSCVGMGWAGNVWTGVEPWIEAERLWESVRASLPPNRSIEIRFEDLIRGPVEELTRVCTFLGVAYDPAMLSYPERSTFAPPDPKLVQQWRSKLSEREIQLVEGRIADMLVARGYELSGRPPLRTTPQEEWRLRLQDRLARFRHRLRLLGPSLLVADYVARRTGPRWMRVRLKKRINRLVDATVK